MQLTIFQRCGIFFAALIALLLVVLPPNIKAVGYIQPFVTTNVEKMCGVTLKGLNGFPDLDLSTCSEPDTSSLLPHKVWTAIPVNKPSVCVDWILYHTNKLGSWEIFRLGDIENKPNVNDNISKGPSKGFVSISPSRSPDGNWVAFTSNRDGNWEIYITSSEGTKPLRVTYNNTAADLSPMWSPDGTAIVYETTRHGSRDLYMFDVVTGQDKRLTDSPAQDGNAFWSSDGKRLLFQSDRDGLWQIYELDIASAVLRKLSDGNGSDMNPEYSSDNKLIAFRSNRGASNTSIVYVMNADGSNVTPISDPVGNASNQVWSADNTMVAYQSDIDGDMEIYVYQVISRTTRRVTENKVQDVAPTWRCNAPFLIFTSDITGDTNLFQTSALPINNRGIRPDEVNQLTFDKAAEQFAVTWPSVEASSLRGNLGSSLKPKGEQSG